MFNRRGKYLVKKKLQLKYLFFTLLSMLVPTIICGGILYYFIWQTIATEVGIPEVLAEHIIPALHKVNAVIFITIPIALFIMLLLSIFISNKIAGPMYRLERELSEICKGNHTRRIKFRTNDELHEIAEAINRLLEQQETKSTAREDIADTGLNHRLRKAFSSIKQIFSPKR